MKNLAPFAISSNFFASNFLAPSFPAYSFLISSLFTPGFVIFSFTTTTSVFISIYLDIFIFDCSIFIYFNIFALVCSIFVYFGTFIPDFFSLSFFFLARYTTLTFSFLMPVFKAYLLLLKDNYAVWCFVSSLKALKK